MPPNAPDMAFRCCPPPRGCSSPRKCPEAPKLHLPTQPDCRGARGRGDNGRGSTPNNRVHPRGPGDLLPPESSPVHTTGNLHTSSAFCGKFPRAVIRWPPGACPSVSRLCFRVCPSLPVNGASQMRSDPEPLALCCRLLLREPERGGGELFGALASPGRPTHPPTAEKFSSGKK